MTVEEQIKALDLKYKEYITGLNLQIAAMMNQYSALTMQYALLLTRVDILEHPEIQNLPNGSEYKPFASIPPEVMKTHTAERGKATNTPPPLPTNPKETTATPTEPWTPEGEIHANQPGAIPPQPGDENDSIASG